MRRRRLKVTRVPVTLPHLPPEMDGFRIVQISDLHLEPFTKPRHIEETIATCNALKPDLVAMTGDFVTNNTRHTGLLAELLSQLHAPCGVFACLGNHDFWCGAPEVEKALSGRGRAENDIRAKPARFTECKPQFRDNPRLNSRSVATAGLA